MPSPAGPSRAAGGGGRARAPGGGGTCNIATANDSTTPAEALTAVHPVDAAAAGDEGVTAGVVPPAAAARRRLLPACGLDHPIPKPSGAHGSVHKPGHSTGGGGPPNTAHTRRRLHQRWGGGGSRRGTRTQQQTPHLWFRFAAAVPHVYSSAADIAATAVPACRSNTPHLPHALQTRSAVQKWPGNGSPTMEMHFRIGMEIRKWKWVS